MHFSARDCARNFVYIISVRFIRCLTESTNTLYMQQSHTGCLEHTGCRQPSGLCLEVCGQIPSTFYGISICVHNPPFLPRRCGIGPYSQLGPIHLPSGHSPSVFQQKTKVTTPTAHIHSPNQTSCKERAESEQQLIFRDSNEEEEGQRQGEELLRPD